MTKVLLYWNNICVLHKHEKEFLEQLSVDLKSEGIELNVRYFGLGYPEHMSEYLARPDAVLPDLIVSTDLEVYDDIRIFKKIKDTLLPTTNWINLRQCPALDAVWRSEYLLPFLSIPLIYYTKQPEKCENTLLEDWNNLAIGGINNSAGKTIVKLVWESCGKKSASNFLSQNLVLNMPIEAFQQVRIGTAKTALVPSIYALRADNEQTFLRIPKEGPVMLPSYLCARNTISVSVAKRVTEAIMCKKLCDFYAENGDLIVFPNQTNSKSSQEQDKYYYPSAEWLDTFSSIDFYEVYCDKISNAINPFDNN